MWNSSDYELIDFGNGRKLESFAGRRLIRLSPAASGIRPHDPTLWEEPDAEFGVYGRWAIRDAVESEWNLAYHEIHFRIQLGGSGNIGIFPEQWYHWDWLKARIQTCSTPPRCLNLFAYTGGSSMMMAQAGGLVTHIDSSNPSVKWARQNASITALDPKSIRWIVEDARKYVERELRRGNRYDLIVLDPPTYGHGTGGESWKLQRDLPKLLQQCCQLLSEQPIGLLLTGHTEEVEPSEWINDAIGDSRRNISSFDKSNVESGRSTLVSRFNELLDCGYFSRIAF